MAHTPEPPPVQRPEAPPVQSTPGPPPVQRRQPELPAGSPSSWKWWPDHPGKRVMIVATAAWAGLLLPTFVAGRQYAYATAREHANGEFFTISSITTHRTVGVLEMERIAIDSGQLFCVGLTVLFAIAIVVGTVLTVVVDKR